MTKRRTTKRALLLSALSLLMCVSMLVGSTFAWFTDSVSSGINVIAAGNLDVEMYHSNAAVNDEKVNSNVTLFKDLQGENIRWEPGVVSYENLRIVNEGDLALVYALSIISDNENFVLDPFGAKYGLSQALKIGFVEGGVSSSDRAEVIASVNAADWTTLEDFLCCGSLLPQTAGTSEETWGVVIYWEPGENDNRWNLNNGKVLDQGTELQIDLGVKLIATQEQFESDAFGADYDADAVFPAFYSRFRASADVTGKVDANGQLTEEVIIGNTSGRMYAIVPQGTVLKPGTTQVVLTVDTTDRSGNIEMTRAQVSRSLDVHIEGIDDANTVPVTVDLGAVMPKGLKSSSIQFYHVENGTPVQMTAVSTLTAHNQFTYNADNGDTAVNMATFSEVTAVVAADNPWNGTYDTSWYDAPTADGVYTIHSAEALAGLGAIVGGMNGYTQDSFAGKTVKLAADLDLGSLNGKVWYPIGYYNSTNQYDKQSGGTVTSGLQSFEGIFDGQGHTISNIYQNTWDMFGDYNNGYSGTPNHYKDGMGLFGFVLNGTVKNLNIDNFQSDGEFSTTGCVAAYASGTSSFEDITITNCNPRAYNVPNGGVVGYAYAEDGQTNVIDFSNVKVDSSNKITALWGSWDVGCGGVLGRVNGATTINMTNCEVGAVIDVFNDVCGNYQYYQYRYAGMLIGTVGADGNTATGAEKVNFSNVTVYVGDWADYYYCEFEKNSGASYSEDYQFSRVAREDIVFNEYNMPVSCTHEHQGTEDKLALYLPFNQLYTGYGWGATPVTAATGVEVVRHFYTITYLDSDGTLLAVEYVVDGQRDDTHNMADAKTITRTVETAGFDKWINVGGMEVTSIAAGNRKDIVLYATYKDKYTVRFVDEDGNVIHSETVTDGTTYGKLAKPATPVSKYANMSFSHWEIRTADGTYTAVNDNYAISADITFYPYYNYVAANGSIGLTPHDTDGDGRANYYTVDAASGLSGEVEIPGEVNGVPVTVITDLSDDTLNTQITSIIIKDGVQEIGSEAFAMTSSLNEVTVPASVTSIGANAFASNLGGITDLFGAGKVVNITYDGTWEQWLAICDDGWDSGLAKNSTVICSNGDTYIKTGRAWNSGANQWEKQ